MRSGQEQGDDVESPGLTFGPPRRQQSGQRGFSTPHPHSHPHSHAQQNVDHQRGFNNSRQHPHEHGEHQTEGGGLARNAPLGPQVDREKICPLLLRVFPKVHDHHRLEEYSRRGREPVGEVQIYTWPDASLKELTELIKEVHHEARRPSTRLSFAFVYPDKKGRNVMRQVGVTHSARAGEDDHKTLKTLNFQTGDFLDVAILL